MIDLQRLITTTALQTLHIEIQTLQSLEHSINEEFVRCVQAIRHTKGRLVTTGIGKSAIIGQKITATLNSTGTPSIFMHAADAVHGDLGMLQPDDLLLCISKSGETAEIKALLPVIKHLNIPIIALVGDLQSSLAQQADFKLYTPIQQEADPNNLAPTASTTAQMVMGDALAMALLALRGFTPQDFAQFHPAGMLGKQLLLKVGDLSSANPRPQVPENAPLAEIILEMTSKRLGATAVLNQNGDLTGIITDGDLRRMLNQNPDLTQIQAIDIMNPSPKTVEFGALAVHALQNLRQHSINQLIVLQEGRYAGILHLHDLVREGFV